MKCAKCGSDVGSRVIRTEVCGDGVIRTRICFGCHVAFGTMETPCEPFEPKIKQILPKKVRLKEA